MTLLSKVPGSSLATFGTPSSHFLSQLSKSTSPSTTTVSDNIALLEIGVNPADCMILSILSTFTVIVIAICTDVWVQANYTSSKRLNMGMRLIIPTVMVVTELYLLYAAYYYGRRT